MEVVSGQQTVLCSNLTIFHKLLGAGGFTLARSKMGYHKTTHITTQCQQFTAVYIEIYATICVWKYDNTRIDSQKGLFLFLKKNTK